MKNTLLTLLFILPVVLLSYQNCSNVSLQLPENEKTLLSTKAAGSFCLESPYENDTVSAFYMVNMNQRLHQGRVKADSDGDGLSDELEIYYGFDPQKRRTNGKLLDSVCLRLAGSTNCSAWVPPCNNSEGIDGLSECELRTLGLNGYDSDLDDVPDALELLFNTSPLEADNLLDPDRDGLMNFEEIIRGRDPKFYENESALQVHATLNYDFVKNMGVVGCSGETWTLSSPLIYIIGTREYTEQNSNGFQHNYNENIYGFWMILKPRNSATGSHKLLFSKRRLSSEIPLNLTLDDFTEVATW